MWRSLILLVTSCPWMGISMFIWKMGPLTPQRIFLLPNLVNILSLSLPPSPSPSLCLSLSPSLPLSLSFFFYFSWVACRFQLFTELLLTSFHFFCFPTLCYFIDLITSLFSPLEQEKELSPQGQAEKKFRDKEKSPRLPRGLQPAGRVQSLDAETSRRRSQFFFQTKNKKLAFTIFLKNFFKPANINALMHFTIAKKSSEDKKMKGKGENLTEGLCLFSLPFSHLSLAFAFAFSFAFGLACLFSKYASNNISLNS